MTKKSLLIVSDDSQSELSRSCERSLRYLLDEKYDIQKASYEESHSKYPDILLILDINPQDSSYTYGIHFLRKYWAEHIKKKPGSPPAVLLSFNTLQELIRNDLRHFALCSEGVDLVTIPSSLTDITRKIEKNLNKRVAAETIKDYLKRSCELRLGGIIEHARKNFIGPYSLLIGSRYVNDIDKGTYERALNSVCL